MERIEILDFGLEEYGKILKDQERIFDSLIKSKIEGKRGKEYILMGEHFPVLTLGRRAKEANVLIPAEELKRREIKVFHIGRGGDVTYHCPGQLIMYPIMDLERHYLGVKDFVSLMEEAVIRLLSDYGVKGERVEGATGVWIGKGTPNERKICAMGIRCSRFCTMHGLALNVIPDLNGFSMINPCGFQDKGVTSIQKELSANTEYAGNNLEMKRIKEKLVEIFLNLLEESK